MPTPVVPTRNAFFSVAQVAISTLVAFAAYAIVSRELGVELLGLWSVTVAICAFVAVADVGVGGSMVRFISMYRCAGEFDRARDTALSALGFVALTVSLAAVLGYFLAAEIINRIVPVREQGVVHELLPFAMLTAAVNAVSETVLGGLEGCERYKLRASAVALGAVTLITTIIVALPALQVLALGIAFAAQSLVVLGFGTAFLVRALRIRVGSRPSFQLEALRPLLEMGWRLKTMGLFNLLMEPVTKVLVLRAGGSEMSGLFEIAARLPGQLRALLIAAMQVTVPRFAGLSGGDRLLLYRRLASLAVLAGAAAFTTLTLALPMLSSLLLGTVDQSFLVLAGLMTLAWFVNVQSAPAYLAYMGVGELRWNLLGHVTMGLLNVVLGYFGGVLAGSVGVVAGSCVAICIGSSLPALAYGAKHGAWPKPDRRGDWIAVLICIAVVVFWQLGLVSGAYQVPLAFLSAIAATGFGSLALAFLLSHPLLAHIRGGSPQPTSRG